MVSAGHTQATDNKQGSFPRSIIEVSTFTKEWCGHMFKDSYVMDFESRELLWINDRCGLWSWWWLVGMALPVVRNWAGRSVV